MDPANIEILREHFNAASDAVRVVALVSPTCCVCQYGAGVVRATFELTPTPALRGVAVWVPMMRADDVAGAEREAEAFADARVTHLWDGEQEAGNAFAKTLALVGTAWDVYLAYAPGVRWEASLPPPAPTFWMHQLPSATAADASRFFVPRAFAQQLRHLLGEDEQAITGDVALLLHAKGLSCVGTSRQGPFPFEELADIVGKP